MNGANWGKLVVRVFALYLVISSVSLAIRTWDSIADRDFPNYSFATTLVSTVVFAFFMWMMADKIAVSEPDKDAEEGSSSQLAPILVAVSGALTFLIAFRLAMDTYLVAAAISSEFGPRQFIPVAAQFIVCAASAMIVVNAKKVAGWIAR